MNITFKTYQKPSTTIVEYNSNYSWRNFIKEIRKSNKCQVYIYLEGKQKISFDFCTDNVVVGYSDIPEGCETFSYIAKTLFGRTFYRLRMTKGMTREMLSQYIGSVLKECSISDIDVEVFLESEIESKLK